MLCIDSYDDNNLTITSRYFPPFYFHSIGIPFNWHSIGSPSWSRRTEGGSSSVRPGVSGGGGGGSRQRSNSNAAKFLGQGLTGMSSSGSSCRPPGDTRDMLYQHAHTNTSLSTPPLTQPITPYHTPYPPLSTTSSDTPYQHPLYHPLSPPITPLAYPSTSSDTPTITPYHPH